MIKKTGVSDRRLLITKNSILMLVMLVVIFLAIFAWYFVSRQVTADGITISAKTPDEVQIAFPVAGQEDDIPADSAFSSSISFTDDDNFPNTMFNDVTSDGKTFIIPSFKSGSNAVTGREVESEGEWSLALSSKTALTDEFSDNDKSYHYLSRDFYVRSSTNNISVQASSYLKAKSEVDNKNLVSANSASLDRCDNSYGGNTNYFSSDAVVGAMRVSLVGASVSMSGNTVNFKSNEVTQTTYDNVIRNTNVLPRFVWIPRPDLKLNTAKDKGNWSLSTQQSPNADTYRHTFYTPHDSTLANTKNVDKYIWYDNRFRSTSGMDADSATNQPYFHVSEIPNGGGIPTLGVNADIAGDGTTPVTFTIGQDSKDYYVYKFTLNVWIEGEDLEARRVMNAGEFVMNLEFGG